MVTNWERIVTCAARDCTLYRRNRLGTPPLPATQSDGDLEQS